MNVFITFVFVFILLLQYNVCYVERSVIQSVFEDDPRRIVVIGDIHGAWSNFKAMSIELGLIDSEETWIAKDTIFVQMGDLIHRREDNAKVVQRMFEYQEAAKSLNSEILLVMGNHDYEQIKWNPAQKGAFTQKSSWYMPDYKEFYRLRLADKLRKLRLIYNVNGFIFTHAGIEKKHLNVAGTTDINEINRMMADYYDHIEFGNQNSPEFAVHRKIASAVWLQWYHDFNRKGTAYCHRAHEVLDMLGGHTLVVGHYFPSSEGQIVSDCDNTVIYSDIGMWYNHHDALVIENETITTFSGQKLENSMRRKAKLATKEYERREIAGSKDRDEL